MVGTSCLSFRGTERDQRHVPGESEDDAELAKELNAMSMEEREKLYDEVRQRELQRYPPSQ